MNKIKNRVICLLLLLVLVTVILPSCAPGDLTEPVYFDVIYVSTNTSIRTLDGSPLFGGGGGGGDVVGPAGATDGAIARYDGVTGKLIQDTLGVTLDDFANLTLGGDLFASDINAGNDVNVTNDLEVTDDADIGGILEVGETAIFNDQVSLAGSGKVWIELRPELDFDIVKKNAVPLSYERGIFTGFELPIYAADNEELFFEICVPDRWDGESTTHIHLDCFLISAQDSGDAFKLQVDYEHYDGGVDIVPNTSTPVGLETATGASAAFQSYHVHFDIPAGDMVGDDILAFRLRRIAVVAGVEIDGNIVFNHAGVIFLCDKLGNVAAE